MYGVRRSSPDLKACLKAQAFFCRQAPQILQTEEILGMSPLVPPLLESGPEPAEESWREDCARIRCRSWRRLLSKSFAISARQKSGCRLVSLH